MNKTIQISHADLDGIASVIVVSNFLADKDNYEYRIMGYAKINKNIESLKKEEDINVIVSDLGLELSQIEAICELPNVKTFMHFDHHVKKYTDEELDAVKKKYKNKFLSKIDNNKCGALVAYEYFSKKKDLSHLEDFISLVNIYDMWKVEDEYFKSAAYPLNDLYWCYGYEKFFSKFKNGLNLDQEDLITARDSNKKRKEYIKNSIENHSQTLDKKLLIITDPARGYNNCFTIHYPEYDFYLILKNIVEESGIVEFSVRINRNNEFEFQAIVEELNNVWNDRYILAGGHEKAGGIAVKYENVEDFINIFANIIDNSYK